MSNPQSQLRDILEELKIHELMIFKRNLSSGVKGFQRIPRLHLENPDAYDIVDKMVHLYGQDGAVEITLAILENMKCNHLAKELRSKHTEYSPSKTIIAQSGGFVCTPVLQGSVFSSRINFTLTGHTKDQVLAVSSTAQPELGLAPVSEEMDSFGYLDSEYLSPDHEVFIPEVIKKSLEISNSYRFLCSHAGHFQCRLTGLVFEMEGKGEVIYTLVSWDPHLLDGLVQMQQAGPLYDIESIQGSISRLHLPHCEILYEKNKLAVVHFTGDDAEVIEPLQVTNTHVIIDVHSLSRFGIFSSLFCPSPIKAQVLLLYNQMTDKQRRKKMHIHLLPGNVPLIEVMRQHSDFRHITTTSKCQLIPDKKYKPFCEDYTYQPKIETFDTDYGPNHHPTFEIFLGPGVDEVTVGLLDENSKEVWSPRLVLLTDQIGAAQMTTAQSSKLLLDILEQLELRDLNMFQWHLTTIVEDDKLIPKAQLENANRQDTVDKMVQKYGPNEAVMMTQTILKTMNRKQLAEELMYKLRV